MTTPDGQHLVSVRIDEQSLSPVSRDQEQERQVAIFDLLEQNHFAPLHGGQGPFDLTLSLIDGRLALDIEGPGYQHRNMLSLTALRGVIKDYFLVCETYYDAIRNAKRSHETPFPQIKWLTDAYRELSRLRKGATHFKDPQHPKLKVDVKEEENKRLVDDFHSVIDDATPSKWAEIETSILDKLPKMHAPSAKLCLDYARERLLGERKRFGRVDDQGDVHPF